MVFTINAKALEKAISLAARATDSKSALASLECLYFYVENDTLIVRAYNLKKGIRIEVGDAEIGKAGTFLVNAKSFCDLIHSIPNTNIKVTTTDAMVTVSWGRSHMDIPVIVEDVPEWPANGDLVGSFEINQGTLIKLLQKTSFCAAADEIRPVYTGVKIEKNGTELNFVALDGYRLAVARTDIEGDDTFECILPASVAGDIQKLCDSTSMFPAKISAYKKHITIEVETSRLLTRRIEGAFLDYRKTIPQTYNCAINVNAASMVAMLSRSSQIFDGVKPIKLHVKGSELGVVMNTTRGFYEDYLDIEPENPETEFSGAFSARYLIDGLRGANSDKVNMQFTTATSPAMLNAADEGITYQYMVLPVRERAT